MITKEVVEESGQTAAGEVAAAAGFEDVIGMAWMRNDIGLHLDFDLDIGPRASWSQSKSDDECDCAIVNCLSISPYCRMQPICARTVLLCTPVLQ